MKKKYNMPFMEMWELEEEIIVTSGLDLEDTNINENDENYGSIWQ